jgi:hypothetical protein
MLAGHAAIYTPTPHRVLTPRGLGSYILSKSNTKECIASLRRNALVDVIESLRLTPGRETDAAHV